MTAHAVLVVDDDEAVRYSLTALLEEQGYAVYTAASGEEAVALLPQLRIHAIIADIWMPGMSGLDLLTCVRRVDQNLPVILLTGSASLDTSIEAVNQGASAYLLKPFSPETVRTVIERSLHKAESVRQQRVNQDRLLHQYHTLEETLLHLQEGRHEMNAETITLISDLIRGLRHELGNLTTVLSLDVSLLEQTVDQRSLEAKEFAELKHNVNDLGRLLTRLKEYPQPNTRLHPTDFRQVVSNALDHVNAQIAGSELHIVYHYEHELNEMTVNGDATTLFRMVVNILENAVDANRRSDGQQISVTLSSNDQNATLIIADEGPGFDNQLLSNHFSPAYTTKITNGFMRGLGMGLFVSHAIVSLHNGVITLENQRGQPNNGALVTITLPLLAP